MKPRNPAAPRLSSLAAAGLLIFALLGVGCSNSGSADATAPADSLDTDSGDTAASSDTTASDNDTTAADDNSEPAPTEASNEASTFLVQVWADNWMAVYVDGELVGEDSVSITTERSFNAEEFTFEATYPFVLGIQAKDFMETESGIEYIGEANQQMGDGGLIAQVTDVASGEVVAVTDASTTAFITQRAPLNPACERSADPDSECESETNDVSTDWAAADFDDSDWSNATEWNAAAVSPKDGYDEIDWDSAAQLIWGTDLEIDNIIVFRMDVTNQ